MHLSAILVTGKRASSPSSSSSTLDGPSHRQRREPEPVPLACVEILGQSVLDRTVARLKRAGVGNIFVIASSGCTSLPETRSAKITVAEKLRERWSAAERTLRKQAQRGIRTVLLAELGAYAEFNLAAALEFHQAQGQAVTPLCDSEGPLGYWLVETAWIASRPDFRLPFAGNEMLGRLAPYLVKEPVNRMANARDLRRLVVDAFLGRCSITPPGREIKPGVWIDEGVRLHRTARLVAPAYLGRNAAVQPAAVITRFSNLERHCQVGEGSVVAHASVLPHTVIGRGLDVSAAVVEGCEFADLRRNITLRIPDPNLLSDAAGRQPLIASHGYEHEELGRGIQPPELEYSGYLSRAAGRLLEVFRDEV